MRMAVAAEKTGKPKYIAVLGAADNHRSAGAGLEQTDAPQDQGAHDPLPQFRFRDQQCPQLVRWDSQGFHWRPCVSIHQRWSAGQLSQFAHE